MLLFSFAAFQTPICFTILDIVQQADRKSKDYLQQEMRKDPDLIARNHGLVLFSPTLNVGKPTIIPVNPFDMYDEQYRDRDIVAAFDLLTIDVLSHGNTSQ
jgi:hypothetical protein